MANKEVHKASHKASLKNPKKKATPLLIPYGRFSKVIIYYLASNNNIHRRPDSAVHHTGDDYVLGNLKFVPKGETVEVFGMAIPDPLITEAIQQSSYYPKYLKMVAANTKKTPQGSASMQPATKRATPKKPTTTTPVKQSKPAPSPTKKPSKRKLPQKIRKGKPTFHLVDEEDEAQQESNPQEEGNDPDLELAKKLSLETHQEKGKGEGDDADLELAIKLSLDPALLPQRQAPVGGVTIRDPVSETTPKLHEVVGKGKAVVSEEQVAHSLIDMSKKKRSTDQFILARRDQTPPDSTTGPSSQPDDDTSDKEIHEPSSTSDSERTESDTESAAPKGDKDQDEVDTSTVLKVTKIKHNPKVHEKPEAPNNEKVSSKKNPESFWFFYSTMKNLDDTYNFGDQFLYDKPTEDDQEKSKVIEESDSTIPDPSHQTVTSTPLVIAPFTNVSSTKPSSLVTPPPINTEATTITTSLPEITSYHPPLRDLALELGKSISLTEAEEEAVAREVHATHARIVSESEPEPTQRRQSGIAFRDSFIVSKKRSSDSSKKLKGIQTLTPAKQEAADIMKALKESKKMSKRQPRTGGSNEGTGKAHEALAGPDPEPMKEDQTGSDSGKLHVSLAGPNPEHMDDEFLATAYPKVHENLKLITDERVIDDNPESHSGSMSSMKNLEDTDNFGDQFLYDKPTEDDQEKSKVVDESDSTIPDPSHQTVTSTPPVIAPFTDVSSTKPSSLVTPPPINTEATTITTSLPEITPFIALQLRVARLEQEMSEVKKTDHSADVLASIESQVPTAVDKYLGTKLDNALLKVLERHTADLIEKHSVLPGPESIQNQESEKSPKEIIRTKREQGEEKQDSTYSIRSTDKEMILKICSYSIFKKSSTICPRQTRLVFTQQSTIEKKNLINLERPNWDAADYYFKEDYTIVPKPRAVVYRDRNDQRKLMRLNELHKFSDGTLTRVMEKLDHMVKDFHLYEYNKGMETRKWSEDDKRRSKDFITAIEKRLQIRRIFRSLESFVGGRIRDIDYRLINRTTYERPHKGVKASANSDVMYFFTSAQDSDPSQDDVRLCLGDDLKKAQDHSQRQANYGVIGEVMLKGRYGVFVPALHKKPQRFEALYAVSRMLIRRIEDQVKNILEYHNRGKAKKSVKLMMEKLFRMELELMLFWSTIKAKNINGEEQLHALVDGKKIIITESTVRRDLQLADEEGVDCLPNSTIFEQLALMGKPKRKDTHVPQSSDPSENVADEAIHMELGDSLARAATTTSSLEAEQDNGNINKTQSKATPNKSSSLGTTSGGGPRCQEIMGDTTTRTRFESVSKHSNDSLIARVIENGATLPKTTTVEGVVTVMPITTAEEKAQRRLEVKARSTLMMGAFQLNIYANGHVDYGVRRLLKTYRKDVTVNGLRLLVLIVLTEVLHLPQEGNFARSVELKKSRQTRTRIAQKEAEEGPNYALMAFSYDSEVIRQFKVVEEKSVKFISTIMGNPQMNLQGIKESNCSGMLKHMIMDMSYLTDYEEIDGGYVALKGTLQMRKVQENVHLNWMRLVHFKSFITGIENLVDHKVKVIRCDNGTEFKNREMNQFCEMKGILRQFSVARTPQQNRVAERRNRTLIEAARTMLADSKTPTLSFMRPFGCLVTILNTIDHLGKFDGKADEGFFVGYSLNSKAFRVFNSRTRIVEENLHIRFSESTPNVIGQARKETEPIKDYILLPLWTADPPYSQDPKSSHDDGSKPSSDNGKKVDEDPRKESECNDQEKEDNVNSTNNVNAAGTNEVNAVGGKTSIELPFDPNMPALEDYSIFDFSRDDEDDGAVADMNNLDTTIQVSPIPTTRIHKDHPLDQVIGDLQSATQTRKMSKNLEEHGFCDMCEELLQFKLQEVWTLVDLPNRKRAIGSKWVFRNKKDKRGIMIRIKQMVVKGYAQEKGLLWRSLCLVDKELIEIRLFLAYASFKDFVVYQMDVKSAFLYGKIEEEVSQGCRHSQWKSKALLKDEDGEEVDGFYCKKQTVVANSTTEVEYVAASSCYLLSKAFDRKAKKSVKLMMKKLFRMELELCCNQSNARKPKRKDPQVPQPSDPIENVTDEVVYKELGDSLVRAATTTSSLEAEHDSGNISKTQSKATPNESSSLGTTSGGGPGCQKTMGDTIAQTRFENVSKHSNDSLLARGFLILRDKGPLKIYEIVVLKRIESSDYEESLGEDASKQRELLPLIQIDINYPVSTAGDATTVSAVTTTPTITTVDDITLAQALIEIKSTKPKEKGVVIQELGESITIISSQLSSQQSQDKGKGILIEPMKPIKKKDLIRLDEEAALNLQAGFDEQERLTREKVEKEKEANIALIKTWDDIQAKIDAGHQLAKRLQAQEQEELSIEEKATLFQQLLEKRRKHFAAKRAEEKRNKPLTKAQQRKIMCTYLKTWKDTSSKI
ncbi:putative ribonuclease H-like domain-containing protein [Tanacetum coccineum]